MPTILCIGAMIVVGLMAYAFVIRFALNWSRSRWDPDGDSRPLDPNDPT